MRKIEIILLDFLSSYMKLMREGGEADSKTIHVLVTNYSKRIINLIKRGGIYDK